MVPVTVVVTDRVLLVLPVNDCVGDTELLALTERLFTLVGEESRLGLTVAHAVGVFVPLPLTLFVGEDVDVLDTVVDPLRVLVGLVVLVLVVEPVPDLDDIMVLLLVVEPVPDFDTPGLTVIGIEGMPDLEFGGLADTVGEPVVVFEPGSDRVDIGLPV